MMKKLIGFLLVLAIGAVLGYVFHDTIDTKLKARFGEEKVEAGKAKVEKGGEKAYDAGKAGIAAIKEELDSTKTE
jgi:hypothetical protein